MSQLHLDIAGAHGLPDEAAQFLSGDTIDQIEASAVALAPRDQQRRFTAQL